MWIFNGVAACLPAEAGSEPSAAEQFAALRGAVKESRSRGDNAAYLANALKLQRLLNGSPTSIVDVMAAQVAAGHAADAVNKLKALVRMGQSYTDLLGTPAFTGLRSSPEYPALAAAMSTNAQPTSRAELVFKLQPIDWVPEDIDYDIAGRRFLITSVLKSQVRAVNWKGESTVFAVSPDHWQMMALKIDASRYRVWVTQVSFGTGRSAILVYDLKSGRLIRRIAGPSQTELGDMVLMSDGAAVISDGRHGGVYRVDGTSFKIERLDHGEFISPQTPAIAPDQTIWIPDYTRGIARINLKSRAVSWLSSQDTYALGGIDGLYSYGQSFILTQNGASPERVVQMILNAEQSSITAESIIERATPTLGDPTHGVVVGNNFYYIANSGWDALDENAHRNADREMTPALLMRVKLGPH